MRSVPDPIFRILADPAPSRDRRPVGARRRTDCGHADRPIREGGTHLRMEQSGFRHGEDDRFYQGANYGWQKYLANLERVAGR